MGNVLNNLGVDAYYRGNWNEALDLYARSGDARQRAGDVIGAAASINNASEIYSDQGKLDEAIGGFRHALYVWESSAFPVGIALASINLGRALTRGGEFEEAAEALARGLELFTEMGAESYIHETRLRMAELKLFERQYAEAAAAASELLGAAGTDDSTEMLRAGLYRIQAYARTGIGTDLMMIEEDLRNSLEAAIRADSAFEQAVTYEAMARVLREDPDAVTWNEHQAELFARLGVLATPVIPLD
jgi:tetratricopeptide (TPR) repeat protein